MLHFILNPLSNKTNKSNTCRDETHAHSSLLHPAPSQNSARSSESGNVFFTLFGAVAVVGVLGAGIMQTMQGPLNTMVQVNLRERAKIEMSIASKLILLESTGQTDSGDCDSDGFVEPLGYTTNIAGLTGGGELPTGSQQDPWGNDYGYCSWDAGDTTGTCAGSEYANLLDGDAPTEASDYSVIAIISAGPDGVFQTTCADHPALDTPAGDDLVEDYTYDTAVAGSGGLWSIKSGTPTSAEIDKNLDLTATSTALGGFSPQLLLGARSLILPTQADASTCDSANDKILRIKEASATPTTPLPVVQICDFTGGSGWVSVAAGASASALADDNTTVTVDDDAPSIVFEVNGTDELTITPSSLDAGSLDIVTTGTLDAGATTITGATGITGATAITGTFDVNGATTLDALTASGATNITGALTASGGATISGGTDPSLSVTGNIGAVDLDLSGELNLPNTNALNWGDGTVNITGDSTGGTDSLVFSANAVTMDGALSITNAGTTDPALDVTGNVDIDGDLDIDGDIDIASGAIISSDNTVGHILVADGTDMDSVLMSGDAAIAANGAVTIQDDAVDEDKLDISNAPGSNECLKYISGSLEWAACSGGSSGGGDGVGTDGFIDLADTPSDYTGATTGQVISVNAATDALEFTTLSSILPPTDRIEDTDGNTYIDVDTTDDGTTDSIIFTRNTNEIFTITGSGGVTNSNSMVFNFKNAASSNSNIARFSATGGTTWGDIGYDGTNMFMHSNNSAIVFKTNGALEQLRIEADGDIGIGTATPDASSILDITSTTAGFLPPRMTEAERDAINSGTFATGLVIYNTDNDGLQLWDGTMWITIGGSGGSAGELIDADSDTSIEVDTAGDGSANTTIFTNNAAETMRITASGDVGIGTASPVTKLDVNGGIRVGSVSGADAPTYMSLDDLSDTNVSAPSDGQYLVYNTISGNWEAQSLSGSSVADDSLDWAQFVDAMTLDASTTIDMDTNTADLNFDNGTLFIDNDGQIGIGNTAPDSSSIIEITSTTQGFLAPRMTTTERDTIASPATSLMVFNTTENEYQFNAGDASTPNWLPLSGETCSDSTPDSFSFTNLSNQTISTLLTSNIEQITGLTCAINASISGEGSPQLRTCSDASCSTVIDDWTSSARINENDYIQIRLTSSDVAGATYSATVTIGNAAGYWSVSTAGGDCSVASPAYGTVCSDGTIYAGETSDGNVKMYASRCDFGSTWDGSSCTGTKTSQTWSSTVATTTNYKDAHTGFDNTYGLNALADAGSPYNAADACANLSQNGHTDWYLPANTELFILISNATSTLNLTQTSYWSSTEFNVSRAYLRYSGSGLGSSPNKNTNAWIRCVRKDGASVPAATPSGSDGEVQFNDGGTMGSNSIFVWDDTNTNLGIGTSSPDVSSILELASTTTGFLPPRMTETQRDAIATPATGLMVYNTTTNTTDFHNGTAWTSFATSASSANELTDTGDGNTSIDVDTDDADTNNTTVFTNAGTQSMIINADGEVGIGTVADPTSALHIAKTGESPQLTIESDATSNFTAIAITNITSNRNADIAWRTGTGSNTNRVRIVGDTGASGSSPSLSLYSGFSSQTTFSVQTPSIDTQNGVGAVLRYTTNLPTSGDDTGLLIDKTDTASNGVSLLIDAQTEDVTQFSVDDEGAGYFTAKLGIGTAADVALDVVGDIEYTGTITDVSDRRLKTDITPFNTNEMINKIAAIDTYSFTMKNDPAHRTEFGVMAQELESIFPELVHTAKDEMGTKSVNYVGLIAPMIEATKSLKSENDTLKAELAAMKSGQDEIAATLASMKNDMAGLKIHTGFGLEKANIQTLALMLLMMLFSGACVMIVTRIKRTH